MTSHPERSEGSAASRFLRGGARAQRVSVGLENARSAFRSAEGEVLEAPPYTSYAILVLKTVEREYKTLFERLVAELPTGVARLNSFQPEPGGQVFELLPANSNCARFGVVADEEDLRVFFMDAGVWEFPWERCYRNNEKNYITEVEEMSRAVIAGQCDLTPGLISDIFRIYVDDYTYGVREMPRIRLHRSPTRRFAPYVSR